MVFVDKITVLNKEVNLSDFSLDNLQLFSSYAIDVAALRHKGLKVSEEEFIDIDFLKWFEYVNFLEEYGVKKILFLDFETTSMNGNALSMGAISLDLDTKEEKEYYSLFNPMSSIDKEASKIHGIYEKDIKESPTFAEKIDEITNMIESADILIAFNAIYDISVLVREYERADKILPDIRFLDLMTRSKKIVNAKNSLGRLKNPSLSEFASCVGVSYEDNNLHNALYDTKIMMESFKKFIKI